VARPANAIGIEGRASSDPLLASIHHFGNQKKS